MKANFRMGTSVALFLLGGIMVSALVACDLLPFMARMPTPRRPRT